MSGATVKHRYGTLYVPTQKSNAGLFPFCNSRIFVVTVQGLSGKTQGKATSLIQTTTNIVWETVEHLHIQNLPQALRYLAAFLVRQGVSVIPTCQKIIWVEKDYWMLPLERTTELLTLTQLKLSMLPPQFPLCVRTQFQVRYLHVLN